MVGRASLKKKYLDGTSSFRFQRRVASEPVLVQRKYFFVRGFFVVVCNNMNFAVICFVLFVCSFIFELSVVLFLICMIGAQQ